jgi:hypothetical protein
MLINNHFLDGQKTWVQQLNSLFIMIISLDEKRYYKSASWMFMRLVPLLSSMCGHGHDHMVVGFTTTYAISAYYH